MPSPASLLLWPPLQAPVSPAPHRLRDRQPCGVTAEGRAGRSRASRWSSAPSSGSEAQASRPHVPVTVGTYPSPQQPHFSERTPRLSHQNLRKSRPLGRGRRGWAGGGQVSRVEPSGSLALKGGTSAWSQSFRVSKHLCGVPLAPEGRVPASCRRQAVSWGAVGARRPPAASSPHPAPHSLTLAADPSRPSSCSPSLPTAWPWPCTCPCRRMTTTRSTSAW